MTDEEISVTEAARNFADCLNRTHYQNKTFVLLKNGVPFARLLPAGERTAYEHARLWALLESTGSMIGPYDLIVAAVALERNAQVATFNTRHFGLVPGLTVIEPMNA
jgi:antitoxin (DNA-binding transcriptional repressor) of toxin-antitoxin stability system